MANSVEIALAVCNIDVQLGKSPASRLSDADA